MLPLRSRFLTGRSKELCGIGRGTCGRRRKPYAGKLALEQLEERALPSLSPSQLLQINPGSAPSNPKFFTNVNGLTFFQANDGIHGAELWATDGTAAGTFLVKDINPGTLGSSPGGYAMTVNGATNVNGTLFFSAQDGTHGRQLWASNGTATGTFLVDAIGTDSDPRYLTNVNGTLFFSARDGNSKGLWESNGTAAGTFRLFDINTSYPYRSPAELTNVSGTLFFSAYDGTHGRELWESNGTTAGTFMVDDINPGSSGSNPAELTNVSGTLFFSANDGTHGSELWESNGTAAGTFMVKDILPGKSSSYPNSLTNVNGTLFFAADDGILGDALWESNGTAAGTSLITDMFNAGFGGGMRNVNGTLFFFTYDATRGAGVELWESNGTAAGISLVHDFNPGGFVFSSNSYYLTNVNGTLFFSANDVVHGVQLWESDGTLAGTFLIKDIRPGSDGSQAKYLTNVNGTLFFSADDGTHGFEPWVSNGSAAGTVMVTDINHLPGGSYPNDVTSVGSTAFFMANDATHGRELWASNGTTAGTFLVSDINPGPSSSNPEYLTNVNGALFFSANDGTHGRELWESNGAAAGTFLVKDINPGASGSYPGEIYLLDLGGMTNVNGILFFSANDGTHGAELWESNGTAAGTFMVADINPGQGYSYPTRLTNVNGTLFFSADDGTHGRQLWASNGTEAGTLMLQDISHGFFGAYPTQLTNVNGRLFFTAVGELWESNGTTAGTVLVKDINPGGGSTDFVRVLNGGVNVNGTLFFPANDGIHGAELWESNGTAAGTFLVDDINPGPFSSYLSYLTNLNGTLFFTAMSGTPGVSGLWESNGTAAGTSLVANNVSFSFANVNGVLFFPAFNSSQGDFELWATNGSSAGTVVVEGDFSSSPKYLTNVNGTLFFAASDSTHGVEPWVLVPQTTAATSVALATNASSVVTGQSINFTATVTNIYGTGRTPTGMIQFMIDGKDFGSPVSLGGSGNSATAVSSVTSFTTSSGAHTITAHYLNTDGHFNPGPDASTILTAIKANTVTALSSTANSPVYGQVLTFTATVSPTAPGAGTPSGTVTFKRDGQAFAHQPVSVDSNGKATFSTPVLTAGTHTITAVYNGDTNFSASSPASLTQVVAMDNSVVSIFPSSTLVDKTINKYQAPYSTNVKFTIVVAGQAPGTLRPPGGDSVTVTDTLGTTTTTIASGILDASGHFSFSVRNFAAGTTHVIKASFGGDSNFKPGTSLAIGEATIKAPITNIVTASAGTAKVGTTLTITSSIADAISGATAAGFIPTGVVYFRDTFNGHNTTIGSSTGITLNSSGQAMVNFSPTSLQVGTHSITAIYTGSPSFAGNTSAPVMIVVTASQTASIRTAQFMHTQPIASPTGPANRPGIQSSSAQALATQGPLAASALSAGVDAYFASLPRTVRGAAVVSAGRKLPLREDESLLGLW
jgi:ELWxxDGT repeat protein